MHFFRQILIIMTTSSTHGESFSAEAKYQQIIDDDLRFALTGLSHATDTTEVFNDVREDQFREANANSLALGMGAKDRVEWMTRHYPPRY